MKLVILFGPQAVGKMTVGQELAKRTGLKLFHNHMTIDLVANFFDYSSREGKRLVSLFRQEIFQAVASSDLPGLIFTYVWAFDRKRIGHIFTTCISLLQHMVRRYISLSWKRIMKSVLNETKRRTVLPTNRVNETWRVRKQFSMWWRKNTV